MSCLPRRNCSEKSSYLLYMALSHLLSQSVGYALRPCVVFFQSHIALREITGSTTGNDIALDITARIINAVNTIEWIGLCAAIGAIELQQIEHFGVGEFMLNAFVFG